MKFTFLTNEDEKNFIKTINGVIPDENGNVEVAGGSGQNGNGLSDAAKTLLITILRNAVYSTNQSANITALEQTLASSGGGSGGGTGGDTETVTYTVTNTLSNVITNNTAASVTANAAYTATLAAADGYEISSVTVLMGGVDVTATAYANGVISIAAVTGKIIITATAVAESGDDTGDNIDIPAENLLGYYDMRTALTADNHIPDLSGNGRDILFYPANGYYENGTLYRGDKASNWMNQASDYCITDGAYDKYSYGENVTMFVTISGFTSGTTPLMNTGNNNTSYNQLITFQNGVILYNQPAGFNNVAGNTALTKEGVTTICIVITSSEEKIYLDGVLKSTSAAKGGSFGNGMHLLMGYNNSADADMKIHNAAVYNAALSDNEVATISATLFANAGGEA
jgi:hypothetical protein